MEHKFGSPYAQQPAAGPCSEPENFKPNLYFCKIQGISIYDNANFNTVYQSSIKNPVSISQKTPSLNYKVHPINSSWRSKSCLFWRW